MESRLASASLRAERRKADLLSRAVKLTGQAIWASLGQLAQALLATISTIILARILGAETYGVFALGLLIVGFAEIFVGGHAADIVVQKPDVTAGHRNAAFVALSVISVFSAVVIWAGGAAAADVFEAPQLQAPLLAMAVLPVLTGLASVPNQMLVRRLQFNDLARIGAVSGTLAVLVGVLLAFSGAGIWSLVIMEIARRAMNLAMLFPAACWRPGLRFQRQELAEVLRFASRRVENNGLTYISQNALPRLFIGQWLGTEALGLFAVARRLLDQLHNILSGPVAAVAFPAAAQLQHDRERLARLIETSVRLTTWVFWPVVLGVAMVAPVLVPLAFGDGWAGAIPVLQILALGTLRAPVSSFNTAVLVAFGRMGSVSFISVLSIVLGAAFLAVGVQYGLVGVAAALSLRQWALWPVGAMQVYRVSGLHPLGQLRMLFIAALPSLIMAGSVWFASETIHGLQPVPLLCSLVAIGVIVYGLAWAAFNPRQTILLLKAMFDVIRGDWASAKSRIPLILGTIADPQASRNG